MRVSSKYIKLGSDHLHDSKSVSKKVYISLYALALLLMFCIPQIKDKHNQRYAVHCNKVKIVQCGEFYSLKNIELIKST